MADDQAKNTCPSYSSHLLQSGINLETDQRVHGFHPGDVQLFWLRANGEELTTAPHTQPGFAINLARHRQLDQLIEHIAVN